MNAEILDEKECFSSIMERRKKAKKLGKNIINQTTIYASN